MFCYRDMTFCAAKCCNDSCPRNWNDDVKKQRDAWMKDGPVAFCDFSNNCDKYTPPHAEG